MTADEQQRALDLFEGLLFAVDRLPAPDRELGLSYLSHARHGLRRNAHQRIVFGCLPDRWIIRGHADIEIPRGLLGLEDYFSILLRGTCPVSAIGTARPNTLCKRLARARERLDLAGAQQFADYLRRAVSVGREIIRMRPVAGYSIQLEGVICESLIEGLPYSRRQHWRTP